MATEILRAIICRAVLLLFRKGNVFYRVGRQTAGNVLGLKFQNAIFNYKGILLVHLVAQLGHLTSETGGMCQLLLG